MSDHLAFVELMAEPVRRRCWLLYRALECLPFDQAVDWAQRADAFVSGAPASRTSLAPARPEPVAAVAPRAPEELIELPAAVVAKSYNAAAVPAVPPARPAISAEQRQQLIDRLAMGARNADLAAEFGLTPKQVQGVRIGCSRDIAARRVEPAPQRVREASPPSPSAIPASVDEVVRFLRQQDDVVVPQAPGEFLVNARFRLPLDELVNRANRIRARQGKPEFVVTNGVNGHAAAPMPVVHQANGHAVA
jgi:hypothetical protein